MDRSRSAEHIMHRVVLHQDPRSRVPSLCGSPSSDCSERAKYRYYAPSNEPSSHFHHYHASHSVDCSLESHCSKHRHHPHHKGRSVSLSEANSILLDDSHTAPLMMFYSDDALREVCRKGIRRGPLRQIAHLLGCFFRRGAGARVDSPRAWAKARAMALLELSKRQQTALAMKQDTIEMLEWKLEQLQAQNAVTPEAVHTPKLKDTFHDLGFVSPPSGGVVGGIRYSESSSEASSEASRGNRSRHHAPQPEEVLFDAHGWRVHDAELAVVVHLFEMTVVKARLAVRYFCKVFMRQMEASGYSVWRTLAQVEPQTKFAHKEHAAFVLESRLNRALFHWFENDGFDESGISRIIDPERRCAARFDDFHRLKALEPRDATNAQHRDFDPEFGAFCEAKMREMWFLFPWNIVFKDSDERVTFTNAFLESAKCVWLLHRLGFSIHPHVTIVRVGKGMDANSQYVEEVAALEEVGCRRCGRGPKVEFMCMPGFQIHRKIIKSQVYRHLRCK